MKQKKTARLTLGMIVATLLTTALVGGAFAKYTTVASVSANGRVAYWGMNGITCEGFDNLFSETYDHAVSSMGDRIIAPGTSGNVTFDMLYDTSGTAPAPEVDYQFSIDVQGECSQAIKDNANIQFKLDDGEYGTFDEMVANLKLLSGDESGTEKYSAGELPVCCTEGNSSHTIFWKWDFTNPSAEKEQDRLDTEVAFGDNYCKIELVISAIQVNN